MSSPALAIQLSEAEMRLLQALVYQECGMYFDARRTHFLQDRLQRRLFRPYLNSSLRRAGVPFRRRNVNTPTKAIRVFP